MKKIWLSSLVIIFLVIYCPYVHSQNSSTLRLIQKIPLINVKGRIDHFAIDLKGQKLFVSALGNNTLEVIDLKAGKQIFRITGLKEPQGVIFLSDINRIYVSNGGTGECDIFDGVSFKLIEKISFSDDADNMRYDSDNKTIFLGYGNGAIGLIDCQNNRKKEDVILSGHPEAFEIEKNGNRIFVNIPTRNDIVVINREKLKVEAVWNVKEAAENFPMALDEKNHRLFIGCREPSMLLVFDTKSGKLVSSINIDGDGDDIFFDSKNKHIFISCGAGFIDVLGQSDISGYILLEKIPTSPGARTSLYVPEQNKLYLAIPARAEKQAEINVYDVR